MRDLSARRSHEVLFQTAQQRIEASGHSLLMTAERGPATMPESNSWKLCGDLLPARTRYTVGRQD